MVKFNYHNGNFKEAYIYPNDSSCYSCRIKAIAEYVEKLENALDKACDELESYDYKANLKPNSYDTDNYKTNEEWKEWCLNEND